MAGYYFAIKFWRFGSLKNYCNNTTSTAIYCSVFSPFRHRFLTVSQGIEICQFLFMADLEIEGKGWNGLIV